MAKDNKNSKLFFPDEDIDEVLTDQEEMMYADPTTSPIEEVTLFTWVSPSRVPRPKPSKKYYLNLGLLLFLIILILFFTNQFYLLMVVLALAFLGYVLINNEPQRVRHTITNFGIRTDNKYYSWIQRGQFFWFEKNHDQELVVVETQKFPYRITMLVGKKENKEPIKKALQIYMVNKKPEPTQMDKVIAWWREKFPLE